MLRYTLTVELCITWLGVVLSTIASRAERTPPKTGAEEINTSITVSTVVLEICSDPSLPLHQRQSDSQDEPRDARLLQRVHMTPPVVQSHQDPPQLR